MGMFDDVIPETQSDNDSHHICLTGHRPHKLDGYRLNTPFYSVLRDELVRIIEGELLSHPHLTLHSGLALGADTVWSQAILLAAERYPGQIAFVAEVPFMGQPNKWPSQQDKEFWQKQIENADSVNVYGEGYSPQAMHARNEGMVRASNLVIAIWNGSSGGTHHAVKFARKLKRDLLVLSPNDIRKQINRRAN